MSKMTEADKIWGEIRDLPLEGLYGLDNQTLEDHVTRLGGTEKQLYLKLRAPAVINSLEDALASQVSIAWHRDEDKKEKHKVSTRKYVLEEADNYVIVKRFVEDPALKKHDPNIFISQKRKDVNDTKAQVTPEVTNEGTVVAGTENALKSSGRFKVWSSEESKVSDLED